MQMPREAGVESFFTSPPRVGTASESNTHQLNQLFQFETTPDICAKGEGYISGSFNFFDGYLGAGNLGLQPGYRFGHIDGDQYREQLQGQYGVTDRIAVGGLVPIITNSGIDTDFGDLDVYAQYKLDRYVNPKYVDLTAQGDLIFPTGNGNKFRDSGKFGFRPLLLAYKDFGQRGRGVLGTYGLIGCTIKSDPDFRMGLGATYGYEHFVGVLEFTYSQGSGDFGRPLTILSPGVVYRGFKHYELAAAIPIGLGNDSPDWGVTLKLTYVFAK